MTRLSSIFAWAVAGLAALAAAAGLLGVAYRDAPAMVEQAQAADLATLFVAVPLLVVALRRRAPLVVAAALAYLGYTYAIFSFEIVVNPLAPVYIAILSLSVWALALRVPELATVDAGPALPRRTTAGFLALVAALFGALWLSEIAGSIASGALPPSVAALAVPTSAVYALDLGFVLPLFLVAAVGLLRHMRHAASLAFGSLVFLVLMALSILPMFAFQAARGEVVDPVAPTIFVVIALVAVGLIALGALGRPLTVRPAVAAAGRSL
jgi:hypothetical protein